MHLPYEVDEQPQLSLGGLLLLEQPLLPEAFGPLLALVKLPELPRPCREFEFAHIHLCSTNQLGLVPIPELD